MSADPPSLDAQIDDYLLHLEVERNLARNTLDAYGRDLAAFARFVLERGRDDATTVEAVDVEAWARSLAESGLEPASQARKLVSVRGFYRYLRRERVVERLPTEPVPLPKQGRRLPHGVVIDEARALLAAATELRDEVFVLLLYGAGLRVSEVVGLELSGVHLDAGVLQVVGKGAKERLVPVGPVVIDRLRAYLEGDRPHRLGDRPTDAVFPGRGRTGRVSRQTVFLRLRRLALAAGLERTVSPHDLRHGFATDLVRGGADLRSVQAMLGHADLRTTEIYTHVDDRHLRRAYERGHPRR